MNKLFNYIFLIIFIISFGCSVKNHEELKSVSKPAAEVKDGFVLGPNDVVSIKVYRHDELSGTSYRIRPNGTISMPLVGELKISELKVDEIERLLEQRLSQYVVDPNVTVNVVEVKSAKAYLLGEVKTPGVLVLDDKVSLLQALANAGGITEDAKASRIVLIRNDKIRVVDYEKAVEGEVAQNVTLAGGDIVYVPTTGIATVSRFLTHISRILGPVVSLESGISLYPRVKSAILTGESEEGSQDVSIVPPAAN